jgi:hypothetical protein
MIPVSIAPRVEAEAVERLAPLAERVGLIV